MIKRKSWLLATAALGCSVTMHAAAQEQQEYQWRVVNEASPTVIPLYNNTPSPFPKSLVEEKKAEAGPSDEELALQQSILERTSKLEQLINGSDTLEPQIGNLQVNAVMKGPQGWSALMNNRWLVKGARFRVPVQASASVQAAIGQLAQMDQAASQRMSALLAKRLGNGTMDVLITKIDAQTVKVAGGKHSWQLPVRQSPD